MRTALKPGTIITINGIQYRINNLLSVSGGMSLIYEAQQQVESSGYAGRTIIKEFFPATNAARDDQGHVYCVSQDPEDIRRFEQMRQDLVNEGIIGEEARNACSQVYAFDHSSDGYAVMREFSRIRLCAAGKRAQREHEYGDQGNTNPLFHGYVLSLSMQYISRIVYGV